jgi:hypothetical protein
MEETSSWLFKQPTGENGPFQELGVGGGHLRVGKSGEDLDAVRLCSPDWLHPPLDGAGVYGEEAVDGKEARLLGQLDNVAMRGDDALYSSREEAQPARVLGDAADEIYVDTYGRSPPSRPHLLQNPEDVPRARTPPRALPRAPPGAHCPVPGPPVSLDFATGLKKIFACASPALLTLGLYHLASSDTLAPSMFDITYSDYDRLSRRRHEQG